MIDQQLASIAASASADWMWDSSCGIYVHAGRAYVTGAAMAGTFNPPGGATLLSGLPSALCPAAPTPVRVWIDPDNSSAEYAPSSATHLGPKLPATMSPAGALTLDAGNPVVDTANTSLRLILDADWPVQPVADTYAKQPMTGISAGWQQVDSTFAPHGARCHLDGRIQGGPQAGGYFPLVGLPYPYVAEWDLALAGGFDFWVEVPLPQGYRAFVNHSGPIGALQIFNAPEQIAGNSGAGRLDNVFFERSPSGYVRRGQVLALAGPLAAGDAGLAWQAFSSYPVVDLSAASSWTGTIFGGTLSVPRALLTQDTSGAGQVAMIVGLTPTGGVYHKLVFGVDAGGNLIQRLYRVDGSGQTFIASGTVQAFGTDPVQIHAGIQVTDQPAAGQPAGPAGTLYFTITVQGFGVQTALDTLGGSWSGQCAVYVPAGATAAEIGVSAIGAFPAFAPGDTLDFTGAGYPIVYLGPTATKVGIGPPGDVRAGLGTVTAGVSGGVRPRGWLRS